jgi:cytochrome c556
MKLNQLTAFAALATAVIAIFLATQQKETAGADVAPIFEKEPVEEEIEIADYMQFLQPYHEKMYWAMQENNYELASFYVHELGEKMLELVKGDVWHNGRNLSEDMKTFGLKPLENLKKALENKENAITHYHHLTDACNSCHVQHKQAVIKIKTPETNRYSNQDFKP